LLLERGRWRVVPKPKVEDFLLSLDCFRGEFKEVKTLKVELSTIS